MEVQANYIIVQGYLGAGSTNSPFSQKLVFTMTPNTAGNRANYSFTLQEPAEPQYPRSLGHKAFVVVRGAEEEGAGRGSPPWLWSRPFYEGVCCEGIYYVAPYLFIPCAISFPSVAPPLTTLSLILYP